VTQPLQLLPLQAFPEVEPGDDIASFIATSLAASGLEVEEGDVLVIAQKIVSKAENCYAYLNDIEPGPEALALADKADKDPRQAQLILDESREVLRVRPGVVIVEHRNGYVHANAGIDKSNIKNEANNPRLLLLPEDPDRSAREISLAIENSCGIAPQIIINDSCGRAWRNGTVGIAIGSAGLEPLFNQIGEEDMFGNILEVTEPAVADELAAAASFVMGQAAESCPVVLVRGANLAPGTGGSSSLIRDREIDLFR
jgi:coenzyme F420-0:L-glutamate ligase / coenzyme F420-1:gamma-L-glutamate ligase